MLRSGIYALSFILLIAITFSCEQEPVAPIDTPVIEYADPLVDIDNNVYKTVVIGDQIWMAENLRVTKFNDGVPVSSIADKDIWQYTVLPAYCWYNNDSIANNLTFGALYNYRAVHTGMLCPVGWHVPSLEEWTTMIDYAGGYRVTGGKLKQIGTKLWSEPNTDATDVFGFNAVPGGMRRILDGGKFVSINTLARLWCFDEENAFFAYAKEIQSTTASISTFSTPKRYGHSVRCIKNQ
jgi:uncharacterized protein (TIGR02145 family)